MSAEYKLHRDIGRIHRSEMGPHWQEKVARGHGPWQGDTNLVLKEFRDPVTATDYVECWHEPPGSESVPTLVLRKPAEDFQIDLFCLALWEADNRNVSMADKLAQVDEANRLREQAAAEFMEELTDEAVQRLGYELRREFHPGAPRQHHYSGVILSD